MDQSAFRQWWKDYDEDNKELRCQFCKELGVMSYDEDFLIMKFTCAECHAAGLRQAPRELRGH